MYAILNDPYDRYKVNEYIYKKHQEEEREIDKPFGYERTLQRETDGKPELYEA